MMALERIPADPVIGGGKGLGIIMSYSLNCLRRVLGDYTGDYYRGY